MGTLLTSSDDVTQDVGHVKPNEGTGFQLQLREQTQKEWYLAIFVTLVLSRGFPSLKAQAHSGSGIIPNIIRDLANSIFEVKLL